MYKKIQLRQYDSIHRFHLTTFYLINALTVNKREYCFNTGAVP